MNKFKIEDGLLWDQLTMPVFVADGVRNFLKLKLINSIDIHEQVSKLNAYIFFLFYISKSYSAVK